ncbi:hypothetical protein Tco_0630597 [Tanacetum coccineum]
MTSHVVVAAALAVWYPSLVKPSLAMLCVHPLLKLVMAMNDKYSSTAVEILAEGAIVWELHQYNLPFAKMHNSGGGGGGSMRNHRYMQLNHHNHHHHRQHLLENSHDPAPATPELVAHNPAAVTPTSSIEFRGANGETSYSLKTSTELFKFLNRIWSLKEQHAANINLIRALKRELDMSQAKIKELARHANAAIQSVRDELEDERKLRKRPETLHRKLAHELYETKTSVTTALKDLEKERK